MKKIYKKTGNYWEKEENQMLIQAIQFNKEKDYKKRDRIVSRLYPLFIIMIESIYYRFFYPALEGDENEHILDCCSSLVVILFEKEDLELDLDKNIYGYLSSVIKRIFYDVLVYQKDLKIYNVDIYRKRQSMLKIDDFDEYPLCYEMTDDDTGDEKKIRIINYIQNKLKLLKDVDKKHRKIIDKKIVYLELFQDFLLKFDYNYRLSDINEYIYLNSTFSVNQIEYISLQYFKSKGQFNANASKSKLKDNYF